MPADWSFHMEFTGNMVALVTPFRNGVVDLDALERLVEISIRGGVSALVPCGTTGESSTLDHSEHDEVIARTISAAAGRVPVIAGTGSNSTAEAVRLSKAAAKAGASAVLSVTPYYNKPSQPGLIRHYQAIADACDVPVVLYDIPGRTAVALDLETVAELGKHPNIAAIKEATGQVDHVTRLRNATSLAVLSGDDALSLPMIALGASGVISVVSNLLPMRMTRLVTAALTGDLPAARAEHDALYPLMRALLTVDTNPVPVKEALAMAVDWIEPEFRLPLANASDAARAKLRPLIKSFGQEFAD